MNNIHARALFVLGLKERLRKLRTEATELAHAIDRWEEGKGSIGEILHELRDVLFVWESVSMSHQFDVAFDAFPGEEHEHEATEKLLTAIWDAELLVDDIARDGDA